MADLSTLDPTQPPDTQAVSQGAQRIRETRDQTKNSFGAFTGVGGTQGEHYLNGPHSFPFGNIAARPASGNPGRIYLNSETGTIDFDTGGAGWFLLSDVGKYYAFNAGPIGIIGAPFVTLATVNITIPSGAWIFADGFCVIVSGLGSQAVFRMLYDGTLVLNPGAITMLNQPATLLYPAVHNTPMAGTHTIAFQAGQGAGTYTITNIQLAVRVM